MKTIYSTTVAILPKGAPEFGTTKRTFYFSSLDDRLAFEAALDDEAKVSGFNLDHVMTPNDALREIEREKALIRRVVGV